MENVKFGIIFCILTISLAVLSLSARAEIINVPDDFETIQAGIEAAEDGDTVLVQPDVYRENIDYDGHNIVVGSLFITTGDTSFIERTIIDGDENDTVVQIASGENEETVLSGFTLQNGSGVLGGGVFCRNSSPSLDHLIIHDNYSRQQGGGIYIDRDANPLITNVLVTDNESYISSTGGGIYCTDRSNATLHNCEITANSAGYGGGIALRDSSNMTLTNVSVLDNFADDYGAGIYCNYHSHLTLNNVRVIGNGNDNDDCYLGGGIYCCRSEMELTNVTIMGNHSSSEGGGILCSSSLISITNSVIILNSTDGSGGGMMLDTRSNVTMNRVIVAGNSACRNGGGILHCPRYSGEVQLDMIFVVTALNSAGLNGGGFFLSNGSNSTLVNGIIWSNSPQQVYSPRGQELNHLTISHSNIEGGEDDMEGNHNLDLNWLEGNLFNAPNFVDPDNNDYNLSEDSPCIEAGTAFFVFNDDTLLNLTPNDYIGQAPDIGALESEFSWISGEERFLPTQMILYPAYPNPFNASTTIHYTIPFPTHVSLVLYDPMGRKVKSIHDGHCQAGNYKAILNADFLNSGVYFVKLRSSDIMTHSRKMVVIK